ncbi:MAG: 1-acyl-sn-glycerol-3-phosphate acyltransferase [Flavobacteriaceae bacterium]|nr:1-acyl-sn-glycerol-3-phosphate acyltransferase [Flavobacteriaceae bacterium]
MKKILTRLWRIWFYLLAAIPVPFLFPFLAIALLFPKGYTFVFWVARNIWAPIILGGSGFYTKIRYAKPLPKRTSYVLVANHTSYIDPFVMLRVSKNPFVFVGKKELVKIPIFGYLYKRAAIMVNRSDKKSRWEVYGRAEKKLALGYSICVFPEVSYEDDTVFLNPFKRGAFKIAIDHQLPVVPMVFYDCKRKHPWYPNFGYPGELRVQTYSEILPPKAIEELEGLQDAARKIIDKGLRDDPKGLQFEAVALEKAIAQANA